MFFRIRKKKKKDNIEKKYVLNVITKHENDGYSSHWYGWNSNWLFTYDEAENKKNRIQHLYDDVEIIELTS